MVGDRAVPGVPAPQRTDVLGLPPLPGAPSWPSGYLSVRPEVCWRIREQLARGDYAVAADLVADRVLSWWQPPNRIVAA